MNRLQKKCVIGTVGIHLLLFLILIVGPAFYNPQPKADNTILDVIPDVLTDSPNSGVPDAQTPPPAPRPQITPQDLRPPPPIPQPAPRIVQPAPTPPASTPTPETPTPSFLDSLKKMFTPTKPAPTVAPDLTPVNKPAKHQDNIQVNTDLTTRKATKTPPKHNNTSDSKAIDDTLKSLKSSLSSATKVDISGINSASAANYATLVKSIYDAAWTLPDTIIKDENVMVKVTIARDGRVISASIVSRSGDAPVDDSVQRALDKVSSIAPFPDGVTENERSYKIVFNPQVKSSE